MYYMGSFDYIGSDLMEVSRYTAEIESNDDAAVWQMWALSEHIAHVLASTAAKCLRFPGNAVGKQAFP